MKIEQYVMAYGVEQDRIRAMLPDGFFSLRPVLRINAEIRGEKEGYIELNTAIEKDGIKGWINIDFWEHVPFERKGKTVTFRTEFLELSFTGVGIAGSCPAEKDNAGCYFVKEPKAFKKCETITAGKEFCDCTFRWKFTDSDARGVSIGKTLPAIPTAVKTVYPKERFTAENAAKIPCEQVLGSYVVVFERETACASSIFNQKTEEKRRGIMNQNQIRENKIVIKLGDITKLNVDCIVNAANESLLGGGGVDGAIHRAAGPELLRECRTLHGCKTGEAKITKGYQLPAAHIIHTVGPIYSGTKQDAVLLGNCYRNALDLAKQHGIHRIAFPAISTGVYGYPPEEAAPIALHTITEWLSANADYDMHVTLSCFDRGICDLYQQLL